MKNLIIENDCYEKDIPEDLQNVLKHSFKENREYWFCFFTAFSDSVKEQSIKRFLSLPSGTNVVCHTTMSEYTQLEQLTNLLIYLKKSDLKINLYIYCNELCEKMQKYLDLYESRLTPLTKEYNDDPELREQFKIEMNQKLLTAVEYHNVYEMNGLCQYEDMFDRGLTKITKEILLNHE